MPFADTLVVVKDVVVLLGTLTTMSIGLYGLRVWKRDLAGKESYAVIREVIKQLHKVSMAAGLARGKVHLSEHGRMVPEEAKHFTSNDAIGWVNDYLDLLNDQHSALTEGSPTIQSAQQAMYPSDDLGDELSLKMRTPEKVLKQHFFDTFIVAISKEACLALQHLRETLKSGSGRFGTGAVTNFGAPDKLG